MKTSLAVLLLLITSVTSVRAQNTRSGSFLADTRSEGWSLSGGTGERSHILFVKFDRPFQAAPSIVLALNECVAASGRDGQIHLTIRPERVTREGIVIVVQTRGDSRISRVAGQWTATGN